LYFLIIKVQLGLFELSVIFTSLESEKKWTANAPDALFIIENNRVILYHIKSL